MDANGVLAYSYDDTGVLGQLATTVVVAAAGSGCAAALGSLYISTAPALYQKTGAGDTDWTAR